MLKSTGVRNIRTDYRHWNVFVEKDMRRGISYIPEIYSKETSINDVPLKY